MILDLVIMIGLLLITIIVSVPLSVILGIVIIGEILEAKETDEEHRYNQSKTSKQKE